MGQFSVTILVAAGSGLSDNQQSKGETLTVIGGMLGHTQTQTTARYAHLFDDPLLAAAELVGESVFQAKATQAIADTAGHSGTK